MASQFKVAHTVVGPWAEGRVVSLDEVREFTGNSMRELKRLVSLGALVPTDEPATVTPLPPGPENMPAAEEVKDDIPNNPDFTVKPAKPAEEGAGAGGGASAKPATSGHAEVHPEVKKPVVAPAASPAARPVVTAPVVKK